MNSTKSQERQLAIDKTIVNQKNDMAWQALTKSLQTKANNGQCRNNVYKVLSELDVLKSFSNSDDYYAYRYGNYQDVLNQRLIPALTEDQYNTWQINLDQHHIIFKGESAGLIGQIIVYLAESKFDRESAETRPTFDAEDIKNLTDLNIESLFEQPSIKSDRNKEAFSQDLQSQIRAKYHDSRFKSSQLGWLINTIDQEKSNSNTSPEKLGKLLYQRQAVKNRLLDEEEFSLQCALALIDETAIETGSIDLHNHDSINSFGLDNGKKNTLADLSRRIHRYVSDVRKTTIDHKKLSKLRQLHQIGNQLDSICQQIIKINISEADDLSTCLHVGNQPQRTCLSYDNGIFCEFLLGAFDPSVKIIKINIDGGYIGRTIMRLVETDCGQPKKSPSLLLESIHFNAGSGLDGQENRKIEKLVLGFVRDKAQALNCDFICPISKSGYYEGGREMSAYDDDIFFGGLMKSRAGGSYSDLGGFNNNGQVFKIKSVD